MINYDYKDIRNFYFENELGERIDCQKIDGNLFLHNVSGLGFEKNIEYVKIGNSYVKNKDTLIQNIITGELDFYDMTYDEYISFIDFVLTAKELKLVYIPKRKNRKEFYRDIDLIKIEQNGEDDYNIMTSPITLYCKTLWYEYDEIVYTLTKKSNEITWDFKWDSIFPSNDIRNLVFTNKGHVEAPFCVEISGGIKNPKITILDENDNILNELSFKNLVVESSEKFKYCTKDTDMYVCIMSENSTRNLMDNLNVNNVNFFKIPKGTSKIRLSGDSEIINAKLIIYVQYLAV